MTRALVPPAPRLQAHPWSRWLNRRVAAHADAPAVRWLRRAAEAAVELMHSENHDPRTNGEFELLRRLGPHLSVVVDAGANRGDWTAEALRRAPRARVVCAELAGPTRELLHHRVACPRVTVLDVGLGEADADVPVKHYPGEDRWTSRYDYPHPLPSVTLTERVRRADDVLAELGVDAVDLLKVDTEGSDLAVLRGCSGLLARGAVGVVQFEYGFACVLARAFLMDFYELLGGYGYLVGRLGPHGVRPEPYRFELENFFGPNFVAVHRSRPDLLELLTRRRQDPVRGRR